MLREIPYNGGVNRFTVEKSIFGTGCLGSITMDGSHLNCKLAAGSVEGDVKRVL